MKKLFYTYSIAALLLASCGKDGSMGPQGPQGQQGEQGLQGVKGEKGDDGSTIYSGAGAPAANLGTEGDFYFRTSNSDFYGPKTASGWGTATNLRGAAGAKGATGATGATGAAGAAGSKILSGTAVPAANQGAVGDFYFRTTTTDFYGPKTAAGWGTAISVRGIPGKDGAVILSGTGAPAETLGNVGDMYLDRNNGNLYGPKMLVVVGGNPWGTPFSLKGERGATGATGAAGAAGSKIHSGILSVNGLPSNNVGVVGDYFLDRGKGDLYGPKTTSGWGTPINLRGTANVISSNWFAVKSSWDLSEGDHRREQSYTIPAPILNAVNATSFRSFLDNGGVFLLYMKHSILLGHSGSVIVLPHTALHKSGNEHIVVTFDWRHPGSGYALNENRFRFLINTYDGLAIPISYRTPSNITLRYVMIPAGRVINHTANVNGRRINIDQLKTMSYDQAGAVFGWEE